MAKSLEEEVHTSLKTPIANGKDIQDHIERKGSHDHIENRYSDDQQSASLKDHTKRRLQPRHISFLAIGGCIGNNVFINTGFSIAGGGPGSSLIAYVFWCLVILALNDLVAEMVVYLPISSPFLRFADRYVDEALGVAASWIFFLNEAFCLPYEISVVCGLLHSENVNLPDAVTVTIILAAWAILNLIAVRYYGEFEFWMTIFKVLSILVLFIITFFVMTGINPKHEAIGFRYWRNPGAFAEYYAKGAKGRFLGFAFALSQAAYNISGPEYISMSAGECRNPRKVMPRAYKMTLYRITFFFILNVITAGIIAPSNNKELQRMLNGTSEKAVSIYAEGARLVGIHVLPHVISAFSILAALSAGNCYTYCASRMLFGLSLEGRAPKFLTWCAPNGVPVFSVLATISIGLLSYLQVSNNSAKLISYFIEIVRLGQLTIYTVIIVTFLRWRKALKAQGIPLSELPYRSKFQPYTAYFVLVCCITMILFGGFPVFLKGNWNIATFTFSYAIIPIFTVIFFSWKISKRTKFRKSSTADLFTNKDEIDEDKLNECDATPQQDKYNPLYYFCII